MADFMAEMAMAMATAKATEAIWLRGCGYVMHGELEVSNSFFFLGGFLASNDRTNQSTNQSMDGRLDHHAAVSRRVFRIVFIAIDTKLRSFVFEEIKVCPKRVCMPNFLGCYVCQLVN
jgi:hypothetical protein